MPSLETVVTGLSATRSAPTTPDMTFVWGLRVGSENREITVSCNYGIGTDTSAVAEATIRFGHTGSVPMAVTAPVDGITIVGNVNAIWFFKETGFVVMFSGHMIRSGVNNVYSSDKNGVGGHKIIVGGGGLR